MALKTLVLIRHGELPEEARGRFIGRSDVPLSESGREMCRELGTIFPRFEVEKLYVSPLRRALESAELVAPGFPFTIDPRLAEIDFGDCSELTYQELFEQYPDISAAWERRENLRTVTFPGGESVQDVAERVREFLEQILAEPEETVGVVTHGGVLVYLLREALKIDREREWSWLPSRGSVSVVNFPESSAPGILKLYNLKIGSFL